MKLNLPDSLESSDVYANDPFPLFEIENILDEKTYKELQVRKNFNLGYLRQHYSVIRLYLNWLRPYLKNIQRLPTV